MTLFAYPRPSPPEPTVHPWPWWRLALASVSGPVLGIGVVWIATFEHLWRRSPPSSGLTGTYNPGLAVALVLLIGAGATSALVFRQASQDRFRLLRAAAAGARRCPGSLAPTERAALFVTIGAPRLRATLSAVAWMAFIALVAGLFRPWWLPLSVGLMMVWHLQGLAPLRVRLGPGGVRVASRLGWTLVRVPADTITAAGVAYVNVSSLGGAVGGRLHGQRTLLAAWVRRSGSALTLNLADGGLVVIGMTDVERAAGMIAGLAGLDHETQAFASPLPGDPLDRATRHHVTALLAERRKLAAIRLVCERTGWSARESRRAVEALAATPQQ